MDAALDEASVMTAAVDRRDVAQTNLELYEQLGAAGYDASAIARMRAIYALGLTLFANAYRGSEKPFMSHLVGTASVAALQGGDEDVVATGLLHAAHTLGRWPRLLGRSRDDHQREILRVTGDRTARLVAEYTDFPWSTSAIARYATSPVDETRRTLLLLRLANEVDDWIGHAAVAADAKSKLKLEDRRGNLLQTARAYGFGTIHALLAEVTRPSDEPWMRGLATGRANTFRQDDEAVDALRRGLKGLFGRSKRERNS